MDRAEGSAAGIALVAHAGLLALLSMGFAGSAPPPPAEQAMEVSFVDEVALEASSPAPASAAAPSAMAMVMDPAPAPAPDAAVAPPRADVSPTPPRAAPRPAPRPRPLDLDPSKFGDDPTPAPRPAPPGMTGEARADIASAIARQVQPCADRQIDPGPGASRIVTQINLRLNRNGSLAGRPTVIRQSGIDDNNRRYAERVADIAIAAFVGCSPLRGLPVELYDVRGGWANFTLNYRLPD